MDTYAETILAALVCVLLTSCCHSSETTSPSDAAEASSQELQFTTELKQLQSTETDTSLKVHEDADFQTQRSPNCGSEQLEIERNQHTERAAKSADSSMEPSEHVLKNSKQEDSEQDINLKSQNEKDVDTSEREELKTEPVKVVLEAFGTLPTENKGEASDSQNKNQEEEKVWTEQVDGTEQKQAGGRRFFSLINLIKFFLNPVIEEFREVEKSSAGHESTMYTTSAAASGTDNSSSKSDVTGFSVNKSSDAGEKEAKNSTDAGKKSKFQCMGRKITENTTATVKVVNSTVLLELLSFDKNRTVADCVLVMFYAPWCPFCAATAPHYNAIARAFPQLEVLAVDTVHFSNLNARFGTVAVPNIMLFYQSRAAVRFNHTDRHFKTLLQFITNTTGLEANSSIELSATDYEGPLSSTPSEETDYLLWFAWFFIIVCSSHIFVSSQAGQGAIERLMVLWQEHQHQHIE